ncbi:relaxase/mobilization nuclease domain-containing protein [Mucilaginibacter sp. UYNi724]
MGENEEIHILDVDGIEDASPEYLQQTIMGMELSAELTKSDKAFLHVQLSPAYGEDKSMTYDSWNKAADILAAETGFEGQRRVIVLHTKKDRTHGHVVFERYNPETGKIIDNKYSKFKMSDARSKIELALGHKQTPKRNLQRFALKEDITALWLKHPDGKAFIAAAKRHGYIIAQGTPKRPFRVVDGTGRSFDLLRQLENVKTKEVRARLRHETLITEKQAIEQIREQQASGGGKREKQQPELKPSTVQLAQAFADNRTDVLKIDTNKADHPKTQQFAQTLNKFEANTKAVTKEETPPVDEEQQRKEKIAAEFAANKQSVVDAQIQQEVARQKIQEQQAQVKARQRQRKHQR